MTPPYPNLIADTSLVNETVSLLRSEGGSAPAVKVADYVLRIPRVAPDVAKLILSDLVETDPRLRFADDRVELIQHLEENPSLEETDFVVFDLETTGAKCPPGRVTEIGAYRIRNGEIAGEFETLVNPEMPIPPFITQLTGITDRMVSDAPRFADVVDDVLEFIGDAVLVAHNAHFDLRFLNHEIGRVYRNYRVGNPHLCTVHLSRRLLPDIPNHRLNTVAGYYSVPLENHHRAADDAYATARIFVNLVEELGRRGISDVEGARRLRFERETRRTGRAPA